MGVRGLKWILLTLALAAGLQGCARGPRTAELAAALRARLETGGKRPSRPPEKKSKEATELHSSIERFYASRNYRPAWLGRRGRRIDELLRRFDGAASDGLDPADYDGPVLARLRDQAFNGGGKPEISRLIDLELQATSSLFRYASDLLDGRAESRAVDPNWSTKPRRVDLVPLLHEGVWSHRLDEALERLQPQHPQFGALKAALVRYRELARTGDWPPLQSGLALKPDGGHPAIPVLRARLVRLGDLAAPEGDAVLDRPLQEAIRRFEERHGLKADGRLDAETIAALNVPPDARARQIELNLERWRWMPEALGEGHIRINIPGFTLSAIERGREVLGMRVVVGTTENPTPIFSDELTSVVFSPYWNVPESIATKEIIPAVLKDPSYLDRMGMDVVRPSRSGVEVLDPWSIDWSMPLTEAGYQFRQKPGRGNSLGQVKFIFPNNFNVYLHDTPARSLFARVERDFSHGCIRIERPLDLARYVLRDQPEWTLEKIQAAMNGPEERAIKLNAPLPVHIEYWTAWVDGSGAVQFRDDLYGHEERLARLLARPSASRGVRDAARIGARS